jgi:O-antigen/teichoic acid export membrane protein
MTERIGIWIAATSPTVLHPLWLRFRASPLSVRLARGVFWSLVGAVISRALGVLSSIIVARLVGIAAFGEFTMIQSTVGLFGTVAGLGLGITATKYVAELRESHPVRCGRIIGLILMVATAGGLVAGAALLLFAPWLAAKTLAAPHLAPLLQVGSALVLFNALQGVYSGALAGFEAFKRVAQVNWMGAVLGAPLLVIGAYADGLRGAVWGSVLQLAVACAIGHIALSRESANLGVKLSYMRDSGDREILWRFGLPAFLSSILVGPVGWTCNILLANQNDGYVQVALLSAANQLRNIVLFLPVVLGSVLLPMLANLHAAGRRGEFIRLLKRQLLFTAGLCLAFVLPMALFSRTLMSCYGPGFGNGVVVLVLTLIMTVINAATHLLSKSMQSANRPWLDLAFSGAWAIALLAGSFVLIPRHGAEGAAIAQIIAVVLQAMLQWFLMRRTFLAPSSLNLATSAIAA